MLRVQYNNTMNSVKMIPFYSRSKSNIILGCVLFLFLFNHAQAQLLVGTNAGIKMGWQSYDDFDTELYRKQPSIGFSGGFSSALKVQKRFLLQLDLSYLQQRKRVVGVNPGIVDNIGIYHYISTPITYKMEFQSGIFGGNFKWIVGAGPNMNWWIAGNGRLKSVELEEMNIAVSRYKVAFQPYDEGNGESNTLYVGEPNRLQLGLNFTGGILIEPGGGHNLLVEFRFDWGHSYLAKSSGIFEDVIAYEDDLRGRPNAIQLSVTYLFDVISKGKKEKKNYFD